MKYQESMIGKELGQYSPDNNCVTHVINVVKEGGGKGSNASRITQGLFLRRLGFGVLL